MPSINLSQFLNIRTIRTKPAGPDQITSSMVNGTIEAVDVMVFILVLGGLIGVVQKSGSFESGLLALTKN